jgi:hypothetical protein
VIRDSRGHRRNAWVRGWRASCRVARIPDSCPSGAGAADLAAPAVAHPGGCRQTANVSTTRGSLHHSSGSRPPCGLSAHHGHAASEAHSLRPFVTDLAAARSPRSPSLGIPKSRVRATDRASRSSSGGTSGRSRTSRRAAAVASELSAWAGADGTTGSRSAERLKREIDARRHRRPRD